jgi:hypothetical protein
VFILRYIADGRPGWRPFLSLCLFFLFYFIFPSGFFALLSRGWVFAGKDDGRGINPEMLLFPPGSLSFCFSGLASFGGLVVGLVREGGAKGTG